MEGEIGVMLPQAMEHLEAKEARKEFSCAPSEVELPCSCPALDFKCLASRTVRK